MQINNKLILLGLLLLSIVIYSDMASAVVTERKPITYDGLFFLGFNLQQDLFKAEQGLQVRQAISSVVDRSKIAKDIVKDGKVVAGIIPYAMEGYLNVSPPSLDLAKAKQLMQSAGYKMTDPRLKEVRLLHTNGVLTKQIAKELQDNLKNIGIKLVLEGIDYSDGEKWENALKKGKYQLFLLGVKADDSDRIETFLTSLLHSKVGESNFMHFQSATVDKNLSKLAPLKDKHKRQTLLGEIQKEVNAQLPIIGLFNIERIQ